MLNYLISAWTPTTLDSLGNTIAMSYAIGDRVTLNGDTFVATKDHTASPIFIQDFFKGCWTRGSRKFISNWQPVNMYFVGDLIRYGHIQFTCMTAHESDQVFKNEISPSLETIDLARIYNYSIYTYLLPWSGLQTYSSGSIVAYKGLLYQCIKTHTVGQSIGLPITDPDYDPFGIRSLYLTEPTVGTDWQSYWTYLPNNPVQELNTRWALGRQWTKNDVVEHDHILYICLQDYDGTTNAAIDLYEPGYGASSTEMWSEFKLWDLEGSRRRLAPGWMDDIPFLDDYISAVDEELMVSVDYPLVQLKNIRDISSATDLLTLKLTAEMHGFDFQQFNGSLLDANSLYRYVSYLPQYKDEAGTAYFLDFINFLVNPPTAIDPTIASQYTVTDPAQAKWVMKFLYTNDYRRFYTQEELTIMYGRSARYTYTGSWSNTKDYVVNDCVDHAGWMWTCLEDNTNVTPSTTNPSPWVLTATLDNVDWSYGVIMTVPPEVELTTFPEFEDATIIPVKTATSSTKTYINNPIGSPARLTYEQTAAQPQIDAETGQTFDDSDLLYENNPTGKGYYQTSRVYFYRTDHKDRIGTDLTSYSEYSGITKLFYSLAPATFLIYVKKLGYDVTMAPMRFYEIGPSNSIFEEAHYIPFICNKSISYPVPVKIGNWVEQNLGTCVTCPQKLSVPVLITTT